MPSKIFKGDMPELLEHILNHLNNEIDSLYSCALVSQHWCKISIPILWQNPFSVDKSPLFISQYFSSLDENEKLVESEATLHKFYINFVDHEIDPEIFYSLRRNEQFFSRLQDLSLGEISQYNIEGVTALLDILAKYTTTICSLKFEVICYHDKPELLHAFIHVIKSQKQLKQFGLFGGPTTTLETHDIISALKSQKLSLQELTFESCIFAAELETLIDCENLEILRIRCCDYANILVANLNTLEIRCLSIDTSNMVQSLQMSGSLLQQLSFELMDGEVWKELLILETLKSFCPNITYLELRIDGLSTQLLELIGNLQNLQFLTLVVYNIPEADPEIRVMHFAKILPSTLQYLDLGHFWLNTYIETLLNNCNAPLKNLRKS
ncbi:hypothetical protein F8M41_021260 [Gigaspora margarita]|uniref:F-box domain-containing protein n=1 Tax=Gigaspora margarita TaxID=4874 RepID=A0A8H4EJ21_GIGMA|nr:hypothetical protein F8M41_021260 [Gigaspora margarita]